MAVLGLLLAGVVAVMASQAGSSAPAPAAGAVEQRATAALARLPLRFEPNRGQTADAVRFTARGAGYALFLTPREAVVSLAGAKGAGAVVRTRLLGALPAPRLEALDRLPGHTSYLRGRDPARWQARVPGYAQVRYGDAYPGIDLRYHGGQGSLEYDFDVAPGADPGRIAFGFSGIRRLSVDRATGDLVLSTGAGSVRQRRPVVYQRIGGARQRVAGRYVLHGPRRVGFDIGRYDRSRPLIIDPVLAYSTYLGGSRQDVPTDVAVGPDGSAYVTGFTNSIDFPTTTGAFQGQRHPTDPLCGCSRDAFVTKIDPQGSALVYSTYLGGSGADRATSIALDAAGRAHVVGESGFESGDFPTSANAFQPVHAGGTDAFVSVLDASGTRLVYSTFLGGNSIDPAIGPPFGDDPANAVAVDAAGRTYVTGQACSPDFPVVGAVAAFGGLCDVFVSVFDTGAALAADTLVASTVLGGSDIDQGNGIAVNAAGVFVVGSTRSGDFPTTPLRAYQATALAPGVLDGFMTQLSTDLTAAPYSTYFGGGAIDSLSGVALDASGKVHVAGSTTTSDAPLKNPFLIPSPDAAANSDALVAEFDTLLDGFDSLVYSSTIGGTRDDSAGDIGIDAAGAVTVTGSTNSQDFPEIDPVAQRGNDIDQFVATIRPDAGGLSFAGYLGGGAHETDDPHPALAVDPSSASVYVTGATDSTDFPTRGALRADAPSQGLPDREDGFLAKIASAATGAPVVTRVAPQTGPAATAVVVSGHDFSGATAVRFGGADASFTVVRDNRIVAVSPDHERGAAPITVTTPAGSSAPNPISRFFYAEGRFDATGALAVSHDPLQAQGYAPSVTRLADGSVLVAGGCCAAGTVQSALATAELYDPQTGTWELTGSMKIARAGHTATLLPDGRVLVAGGNDPRDSSSVLTAELYDPASGTWRTTGALTVPRTFGHRATLLPNGRVLVTGGIVDQGDTSTDSAEFYDPDSGTWRPAGKLAVGRTFHTATPLADGRVLVAGGAAHIPFDPVTQTQGRTVLLSSAELYDPASDRWSSTEPLAIARQSHAATALADGTVLVTGGRELARSGQTSEIYHPATGSWSRSGLMTEPRDGHAAVLLPSGKVLLVGGATGISHLKTAELFDPVAGQFSPEGVMTRYRGRNGAGTGGAAVLLSSGRVLVVGGDDANTSELYTPPAAPAADQPPAAPAPAAPGTPAPAAPSATRAGCPPGKHLIRGTSRRDRLTGTRGADIILAEGGADVARGAGGADCLYGATGGDRLSGDSGADRLFGQSGNDRLSGGTGADRLVGGSGRDRVSGGAGNDRIEVRDGVRDQVDCGRGRDTVVADTRDHVARDCEVVRRLAVRSRAGRSRAAVPSPGAVLGGAGLRLAGVSARLRQG